MKSRETLGKNILPKEYKITIEPDFKLFSFKGEEEISMSIGAPTSAIKMNVNGIRISKATVIDSKGSAQSAGILYNSKRQTVSLSLKNKIVGSARVLLSFSGKINDSLAGMYKSSYTYSGKQQYVLTTQFEAPDARRAFPCFDEPELKAVFKISLLIDNDKDAISNMPIKKTQQKGSKKLVIFEPTPRMSTYLVYIGVGKFEYVNGRLGKLRIRAVTTLGKRSMAKLPVAYAKKFIRFYENYFNVKYPLPKLDLIAVPDFAMGAMENWGAITFRELDMLCDENSSVAAKQKVAITVAHELAHQWFGDLVTMQWWNDLWLNESFATFMSYKAVNAAFPEWEMNKRYVLDTIATALSADSLKNTHPISVTVNTPGEISSIFDRISYEKGGSVLNMLEDYVGKESFRKGLNYYLKKHAYANATAHDLWNAISVVSKNKEFTSVAKAWITKKGYPVLNLRRSKGMRGDVLEITQKRFLISGESSGTWPVPVHYLTSEGKDYRVLLNSSASTLSARSGLWTKLNYGQNGLYRSRYYGDLYSSVLSAAREHMLSDLDVWGLEDDMFALTRSSVISAKEYLDNVMEYFLDAGYPANINTIGHLNWIYMMLYGAEGDLPIRATHALEDYCLHVIRKLGFRPKEGEKTTDKNTRSAAILGLGIAGNKKAISFVSKEFSKRKANGTIDSDTRSTVYMLSAWNGNANTFKELRKLYERAVQLDEKYELLAALAGFQNNVLIRKAFSLVFSKSVKLQDSFILPMAAAANPAARQYLLDWTLSNWRKMMNLYPESIGMLSRFVNNLGVLNSEFAEARLVKFFKNRQNMRDDIEKEVRIALERIAANVKFVKKNLGAT
ncbi:MAG: M1 family metallopeptidase [Candidatus Micrarchaeaceae archaeon]